jgi:5-methylcytosine-specific restriction endonuclease McrA
VAQTRQTRADYLRNYNKAGRQQRRAKLIEMLGGCCVRCGAIEDLEFDHIDPSTKRFAVGSSMSRAWDVLVAETLKCQLLCRPCHREKAVEDRPEPAHSYYRYWYYGCRCAVCRAANAAKSARLRQGRIAQKRGESVGTTEQPPRFEPLTWGKLPRLDSNQEPAG